MTTGAASFKLVMAKKVNNLRGKQWVSYPIANHVTQDGTKTLCGLLVAVEQKVAPSIHTIGCQRCFTAFEKGSKA